MPFLSYLQVGGHLDQYEGGESNGKVQNGLPLVFGLLLGPETVVSAILLHFKLQMPRCKHRQSSVCQTGIQKCKKKSTGVSPTLCACSDQQKTEPGRMSGGCRHIR